MTRRYSTSTYLTALSNRAVKKFGRGVGRWRKNLYVFKAKERKQYQNNGTENLFVAIIYLIEAFKMSLLLIAESFESLKRSNSTFKKWLGRFLKEELMLDMSMKRDLQAFLKIITATTTAVPFCFQGKLWRGFPSTKHFSWAFNTTILVSF